MDTKRSLVLALLLAVGPVGCKQTSRPGASTQAVSGKQSPLSAVAPSLRVEQMTDDQLLRANESAGLGIGLRAPLDAVKAGDTIPLRILFEDLAATTPVGAGLCSGLFFSYQNTQNADAGGIDISNRACENGHPYPDSISLEKGKVKVLDFTGPHALHIGLLPGTYTVAIRWDAAPVNNGGLMDQTGYATLRSNEVKLTVLK